MASAPWVRTARRTLSRWRRGMFESVGNFRYSRPGLIGMEKHLDFRNGFFIETGGHDGFTQSNTYYLEKKLGWSGVLVEGIPDLYRECRRNRSRSRVFNCALVAPDFPGSVVEMHYASLMSVVQGSLKTDAAQSAHVQAGVTNQQLEASYTVRVPARTLESVLDEAAVPSQIDFFSLDVEGYELPVLRGLNLDRYAPRLILVEARFFEEVNTFLSPRYELIERSGEHDCLYRLNAKS
jgi:FkbM family methyltransferase